MALGFLFARVLTLLAATLGANGSGLLSPIRLLRTSALLLGPHMVR